MLEQFHECFGRSNFLHPSHEAGLLPSPHLAGCPLRLHEGSRLSAVIGLCRSLWRPLAAAAEGANSSASESICLRREGHLAERAGSGVWVGTPDPVDLSSPRWAPPYSSRPRQLSLDSSIQGAKKFNHCTDVCLISQIQGRIKYDTEFRRELLKSSERWTERAEDLRSLQESLDKLQVDDASAALADINCDEEMRDVDDGLLFRAHPRIGRESGGSNFNGHTRIHIDQILSIQPPHKDTT